MEISENTIGYEATGDESQPLAPVSIYSLSFDAEQLLAVYGALDTYLKVLVQQSDIDLEAIARTVQMMTGIKPRAVEASKSLALKSA